MNEGPNWPYWRGCSRISIHCEKILILDGVENGGFLDREYLHKLISASKKKQTKQNKTKTNKQKQKGGSAFRLG